MIAHDPTPLLSESRAKAASVTPLNADVLLQMVQQNDEKAEEGHHRLRQDIRALEGETGRILAKIVAIEGQIRGIETRQPVLSNVLVPWQMVIGAVLCSIAIVGSVWGITYGLRSDVRDLLTTQESHSKLEDERYTNMKQMQEMQRVQTESLTRTVLTQQGRTNGQRR